MMRRDDDLMMIYRYDESTKNSKNSSDSKFISNKETLTTNDTHDTSLTTTGANILIITNNTE